MKKIIVISLLSIVAAIAVLFYVAFNGNPISKYVMERDTRLYLEKKGYKKDEILSIESTYNMKRNTDCIEGTITKVVFKDEQNVTYIYVKHRKDNRILQHCEYYNHDTGTWEVWEVEFNSKRKHMERTCIKMY
ncbi:hypothetical protein BACCIP111899_00519 [Bacillus rhizoplanae]|uniref:DUF3139 domain-containing protein n=1 Tax=Bacillus rhizoplanae TaxID=2880966 RepID=A0ABM8Y6J8_9BACI|nr:DUF3139 domain-containing protein [Bacillus rhizoplanae]CAG9611347.1 hypothetical protein BACCIP111899_00519 [Bacillus rhizoplanae]